MSERITTMAIEGEVLPLRLSRSKRERQKWEVTEADLNMYSLIVGRTPSDAERVAAMAGESQEAAALRQSGVGGVEPSSDAQPLAENARPWSPAILCAHLMGICCSGISLGVRSPNIATWVRRVSEEARKRLVDSHVRVDARPR